MEDFAQTKEDILAFKVPRTPLSIIGYLHRIRTDPLPNGEYFRTHFGAAHPLITPRKLPPPTSSSSVPTDMNVDCLITVVVVLCHRLLSHTHSYLSGTSRLRK